MRFYVKCRGDCLLSFVRMLRQHSVFVVGASLDRECCLSVHPLRHGCNNPRKSNNRGRGIHRNVVRLSCPLSLICVAPDVPFTAVAVLENLRPTLTMCVVIAPTSAHIPERFKVANLAYRANVLAFALGIVQTFHG